MSKPTDAELDILTEEEIEALNDDSFVDEGQPGTDTGVTAVIPDDEAKPAAAADTAEDDDDVLTDELEAPVVAETPGTVATPETAAAPAAPAQRNFGSEIKTLTGQQQVLARKFDEGELTAEQYEHDRRQIEDRLFEVKLDERDARKHAESAEDVFMRTDVPQFLAAHPAYAPGTARYHALNGHVLQLQNDAIAAAGGDESAQYNRSFLQQAFDKVERELGGTVKPAATGLPERVLPPSLAATPAASSDDDITTSSRWANLDRLAENDPEAYERALGAMSEADQSLYLAQ